MLPNIQDQFERLTQKRNSLLQHLDSQSPETLEFINVHFDNHVRHVDVILARVKD